MPGPSLRRPVRQWPVLLLTVILVALFTFLGDVSGPTWSRWGDGVPLAVDAPDIRITDPAREPIDRPARGTYEVVRTEIDVDLGSVSVPAWVFEPVGGPPGPGVVFIHGAGTVEPDAFEGQVQAVASTGVRAIVPAKRMDTYSTRHRDYTQMAEDYLASWRVLRDLPGVDRARVGFYGESEGAWIAPVAAASQTEVAFVILASAPVVSPREQAAYAAGNYLANTNVPKGLFRSIPRALGATIPGGGFEYIDFDVRPFYERLHQPVLMVYGTGDASMPIVQGQQITQASLAEGGNTALTTRYIAGADHGLNRGEVLAPEVGGVLADWLWGLPRTAHQPDPVAGDVPTQRFSADPVPAPRWYASGDFLVYSALVTILVSLGGVVTCAWSAFRRRTGSEVARYAVAAVLAAGSTIAFFLAYVALVADLAVNYRTNDLLVAGGWSAVNAAGVFAVLVTAASLRRAYPASARDRELSRSVRVGVWLCHAGTLALLLIATYWGVLPVAW